MEGGVLSGSAIGCALLVNGSVACWGSDTVGKVGDGGTVAENITTPVLTNTSWKFKSIGGEGGHVCGVLTK